MNETRRLAARLVGFGFDGLTLPEGTRKLIEDGSRVCFLFKRNVESPKQFFELLGDIKRAASGAGAGSGGGEGGGGGGAGGVLCCVDQEGGRVQRLREPLTVIPPMRALGLTRDAKLAYDVATVMARELRVLNVDLTAAPVMDVDTNPANPVIGTRSLSGDVGVVCELGSAMVRGFQDHGVAACAKHFPGHGDTSQDSHYDLPRLKHSMDRLEAVELKPFDSAVKAGVSSMMSAHVIFEPLDAKYPATMSRPALDGILRDRFGFRGVVFSDDLEMKAIADHYALEESLIRGLNAGIDVFLVCHHLDIQRRAADIIAQAVERGTVSPGRFREALTRIDGLMTQYCKPPASTYEDEILGCAHHQQVIDRLKKQVDSAALAAGKDPTEFLKILR